MRLTLRTLLAYLDDILDPEDAQQLQKKIEDSEFATSLVHQIKGSVRQLRLDAPALDAQGIGGDLNSVAEYLDNVLPPEEVPSLEKACLENPVNLGEIASCHQILTLVLGEPATSNDSIRNRAYAIAPTAPKTPLPPVLRETDGTTKEDGSLENADGTTRQHPPHTTVRSPSFARRQSAPNEEVEDVSRHGRSTDNSGASPEHKATTPKELSTKEAWRREAQENPQLDESSPDAAGSSVTELGDSSASNEQNDEHHTVSSPRSVTHPNVGIGVAVPRPAGPNTALPVANGEEETNTNTNADVVTIPATPGELERQSRQATTSLDRKITWQRSAFFTGLIALLILLGLMFASRPDGHGYFVEWFGRPRMVAGSATNADANGTTSTASTTANNSAAMSVELASQETQTHQSFTANKVATQSEALTSQPNPAPARWVDPSQSQLQQNQSTTPQLEQPIQPPTTDQTTVQPSNHPSDTSEVPGVTELSAATSNTAQPPVPPRFSAPAELNSPTTQAPAETLTPLVTTTPGEDLAGLQPTNDPLPDVAPETNINVDRNEAGPDLGNQVNSVATVPSDVTENTTITRDLPPRQNEVANTLPEVPATTAAAEVSNLNRSEIAAANSVQTDSSASIETPIVIETEEVPINPPVASPTNREITAIPIDDRLPVATSLAETPEPPVTSSLPPTRLRRGGQLLLALDTEANDWKRIDSTEPISANTVIQCLPSFRSDISIGPDRMCTLVSATRIQLGPQDNVTLQDGKLLLKLRNEDATQTIRYRGVEVEIANDGEQGTVAIEASRPHIPGTELSEAPHSLLEIHPVVGKALIRLMGRNFELGEKEKLVLLNSYPPRVLPSSRTPLWATQSSPSPRDGKVVENWERSVPLGESIELWLKDRASKRYQRRALAARCLAELGEYGDIVRALGDAEQRAYWEDHFATLRRHLTRGTEWVEKLQLEVQSLHEDDAALMLELLRGYSQRQLGQDAAAQKLVGLLRNDKLELRVLALHNLKLITGADLRYEPEATEAGRRAPTGYWEKRLKRANGIQYRVAPDIVKYLRDFTDQQ